MWQALSYFTLIRDMNRWQPLTTRRETIHGGSTPSSMRVDRCPRFMSLTINGTAVIWTVKLKAINVIRYGYIYS